MKRITVTVYLSPELKEAVRLMAEIENTNESTFLKRLIIAERDKHKQDIAERAAQKLME
jgi:hypothetical protein